MQFWWIIIIGIAATILIVISRRMLNTPGASRLLSRKELLCVTCWYGEETTVYGAPHTSARKLFFTNNSSMIQTIVAAGWEPVVTRDKIFAHDTSPLDPLGSHSTKRPPGIGASSLQSKQIKFLQFPPGYEHLVHEHHTIVYMDHKRIVADMSQLMMSHTADILIRLDENVESINQEIRMTSFQSRYSRKMKETIAWVTEQDPNSQVKIMNTGVIVYNTTETVRKLCRRVFETCLSLQQPACQIVWAVLAPKYEKPPHNLRIKLLKYRDVLTRPVFLS